MKKAAVQLHFWEPPQYFEVGRFDLAKGEQVLVKTEMDQEAGEVVGFAEEEKIDQRFTGPEYHVIRKINSEDKAKLVEYVKKAEEAVQKCRDLIKKYNLPMNLVDCEYSFDGGKMVFTFTAESRVDFRDLVKDLSHFFQKSIRLQQIGIRDETKRLGDIGVCGRQLCCQTYLKQLGNVSSDLARSQQVAHRGSDRISGACGRLICCLAHEEELYRECSKNLPPIGRMVRTDQGRGEVVAWNILKQTVDVRMEDKSTIEVPVKGNEQCTTLTPK
ncbi:stage 0 sporulation protein [Patescibacteria group bacterium]|nr:stage 0 sporulation protein [Patescibacteria group bacterium]